MLRPWHAIVAPVGVIALLWAIAPSPSELAELGIRSGLISRLPAPWRPAVHLPKSPSAAIAMPLSAQRAPVPLAQSLTPPRLALPTPLSRPSLMPRAPEALPRLNAPPVPQAAPKVAEPAKPDLRAILLGEAARAFYGTRRSEAAPLIEHLWSLGSEDPAALRLFADFYQSSDPSRAALALDLLHRRDPGDARTWFQRGDVAERMQDLSRARRAWRRSLEFSAASPVDADMEELHARTRERLGERDAALCEWERIARAHPDRLAAPLTLAWAWIDDPAKAGPYVLQARRIAPTTRDVRMVYAQWLRASGRHAEALPEIRALRLLEPASEPLLQSEATSLHALGRYREASSLLGRELKAGSSEGVRELYRGYRDEGMDRAQLHAWQETAGSLERGAVGLSGRWLATDELSLETHAMGLRWGAGVAMGEELGLGGQVRMGAWRLGGHFEAFEQAGTLSPLGGLSLGWADGGWSAEASVQESRWEDSAATTAGGREQRAQIELSMAPDPHLSLRTLAAARDLTLGATEGLGMDLLAEARVRPDPTGPWSVSYQYMHRDWGSVALSAGLPQTLDLQLVGIEHSARLGGWSTTVSPGLAESGGTFSPTFRGAVTYEAGKDLQVGLQGTISTSALSLGSGGYQYLGVTGHWWF